MCDPARVEDAILHGYDVGTRWGNAIELFRNILRAPHCYMSAVSLRRRTGMGAGAGDIY
jgi:hypothetical protein